MELGGFGIIRHMRFTENVEMGVRRRLGGARTLVSPKADLGD
jgi:hypothetical protein